MIENYKILVDDKENEEMLWHSGMEIAFVLNGHGVLFLDGEKYEIQEEDLLVINSYQIHRVELKSGSHLLSVLVDPQFVAGIFSQAAEYDCDCRSFACSGQEKEAILQMKQKLAKLVSVWSKSREEFSALHQAMQMAELLEYLFENFGKKREKNDKKEDNWLDLVRYINEAYQENITLRMLAKKQFMSQSYFSRMFQKEMGVTFTEYLTEIRLSHALNLLSDKERTVTDICFETGFRNVNSFIESFKQKYGMTPGQYRRERKEQVIPQKVLSLEEGVEFSALFAPLMKYMPETEETSIRESGAEVHNIRINAGYVKAQIKPVWRQLLNVGYAKDFLNVDLQEQIKRVNREIGFRYVRFHGLLDDDMMLYREREDGSPVLNYHYVDQVLDFVLQQQMRPYIEFGYMPGDLAENRACRPFFRSSILSFPKDMERWKWLVCSLIRHWQNRYGKQEVRRWIFSPVFGAEILFFYHGEQWERYLQWYQSTWECIRECDASYCVASPPWTARKLQDVEHFLSWCEEKNGMPDWLSLICFHTADPAGETEKNVQLVELEDAFPMAVSGDENYLANLKKRLEPLLQKYGIDSEKVFLAEWNSNVWQRDLVNDTCYKAAYFFKNILENVQNYGAFGYWVLSDIMEELPPAEDLFHGGFGLFTTCGIAKSGYQALCLLNQMGDRLIAQGEGYMVTKKEDEMQVFLYNYCHYETLYRYRHATNLSRTDRYQVFCQEREKRFCLRIQGMDAGMYRMKHYEIDRAHGSAYDAWVAMGALADVNVYEREYLKRCSYPSYRVENRMLDTEFTLEETVGQHEVRLIRIQKAE